LYTRRRACVEAPGKLGDIQLGGPRILDESAACQLSLVGEDGVVHVPETTLLIGAIGGRARLKGERVNLRKRIVAIRETHFAGVDVFAEEAR
jgi:hypothetical protein